MKREELIKLGFRELSHFTIGNNLKYDCGRNRLLSISCFGTPNEMMMIMNEKNKIITDIIVIHNFDYDGYLTKKKIIQITNIFKTNLQPTTTNVRFGAKLLSQIAKATSYIRKR